jgi:hypothetical protein
LPTAAGALGAGTNATSAAVKAAKAEKMAGYLRSTDNKVNAVVHTATIAGFDPARVRAVSQEHRVWAKDGSLMGRLLRRLLGRCMSRWKGRSGGWRTARCRRAAGAEQYARCHSAVESDTERTSLYMLNPAERLGTLIFSDIGTADLRI